MFGLSCKVCTPADPAQDTVRISFTEAHEVEERLRQERIQAQEELWRKESEDAEARRRAEEEAEAERRRHEAEEAEACRRAAEAAAAEQRRLAELQRQREEEAQRAEQEREAEEARRVEEERLEAEHVAQEQREARKKSVDEFLQNWGFKAVEAPKKTTFKTSYALHKAAKLGDLRMVEMLLEEGASKEQKNSRGQTAEMVAKKQDSKGSHGAVIAALQGAAHPQRGGA